MILPRYAFTLARTKLRSKRIMLFTSIIFSSVLFAVLVAGIIVFSAVQKSASSFIQKANNGSYLAEVSPVIPTNVVGYSLPLSLDEVHRITNLQKNYYDSVRAKYKQLGLAYDSSAEIPALKPSAFLPLSLPEEQRVEINYQSPVIALDRQQKLKAFAASAKNTLTDLKAIGNKYGAKGYYTSENINLGGIPNMMLIQNGKENFEDMAVKAGNLTPYGYFTNAIHNGEYRFEAKPLLERYLLPSKATPKGIPVIVSAQEAARLFGSSYGIGNEPKDSQSKTTWLRDIQTKLNGYTYQTCYRNAAEMAKITKIQQDYAEIVSNEHNPDYKKPSLLYALPQTPCGNITVKQDTRTSAEKQADQKSIDIQKQLGTYQEPVHRLIIFQIVGILNAEPYANYTDSIQSYLQNLLSVQNMTMSAIIPKEAYEALPSSLKVDDLIQANTTASDTATLNAGLATHILSFQTIDAARSFMTHETCPSNETSCTKLFTADPYGSNYLILNEVGKFFQKAAWYVLPVVFILALIIIWFTVARVMAENRKEIAVYRAMGAKRSDIAAIYAVYSLILAFRIGLVSLLLGVMAAYIIDAIYNNQLTDIALASFGAVTNEMRFSLFDLSSALLWIIPLSIFAITLLASLQPLVRNVLRPPINDIRTE